MSKYEGPATVGQRTVVAVSRLLHRHKRPMPVSELMEILDKSRPTILAALKRSGAHEDASVWPRVWSMSSDYDPTPQLGSSAENVLVPVILNEENWVSRWNGARQRMGAGISAVEIKSDADPEKLYTDLLGAAQGLASVVLALQTVKNSPDWYTRLGGKTDEVE